MLVWYDLVSSVSSESCCVPYLFGSVTAVSSWSEEDTIYIFSLDTLAGQRGATRVKKVSLRPSRLLAETYVTGGLRRPSNDADDRNKYREETLVGAHPLHSAVSETAEARALLRRAIRCSAVNRFIRRCI